MLKKEKIAEVIKIDNGRVVLAVVAGVEISPGSFLELENRSLLLVEEVWEEFLDGRSAQPLGTTEMSRKEILKNHPELEMVVINKAYALPLFNNGLKLFLSAYFLTTREIKELFKKEDIVLRLFAKNVNEELIARALKTFSREEKIEILRKLFLVGYDWQKLKRLAYLLEAE